MNEFNLNPIPHNPISKVTNDRNPKREQKKEEEKKKDKDNKDSFASQVEAQEEQQKKVEGEVGTDSFSVGSDTAKPGYTMDWVKINNLKNNSKNET